MIRFYGVDAVEARKKNLHNRVRPPGQLVAMTGPKHVCKLPADSKEEEEEEATQP